MAGAWEHSENTVCFVGLAVATACARRWWSGGGSPWKCSVSSCTANHSNSTYLSSSPMWCMSWWTSAMQDGFWLVVLRLRNLSVLSKCDKKVIKTPPLLRSLRRQKRMRCLVGSTG